MKLAHDSVSFFVEDISTAYSALRTLESYKVEIKDKNELVRTTVAGHVFIVIGKHSIVFKTQFKRIGDSDVFAIDSNFEVVALEDFDMESLLKMEITNF